MANRPRFALVFALAALAAGCGRSEKPRAAAALKQAPDFELKGLAGRPVKLGELRGKVVLLDFWATYCGPCHDSIPVFQRLYDEYRTQGLEVVGVSLDAFDGQVPAFAKEMGMTYPVALDPEGRTQRLYGIRGLPTTFLLDRNGVIREQWLGFDETMAADIRTQVRSLLQEKANS